MSIKERADLVPRPSLISLEGPRPYLLLPACAYRADYSESGRLEE